MASVQDLVFTEISSAEWDDTVKRSVGGNVLMLSGWEQNVTTELPFVRHRHFRYGNKHFVRVAEINGRYTTTPFSDGSDVVSLDETPLDLAKFKTDAHAQFGEDVRLRINERYAPVVRESETAVVAHEYVADLHEPLLPRVRKTLRHILQHSPAGTIEITNKSSDIKASYDLYVRHMRSVRNFALPRKLFDSLVERAGADLWVWREGGRVRAVALFLSSEKEVLYSLSAADSVALAQHAPHHLVYTALESYREKGIERASLGATGTGSALEVFKRGWRGEEYRIFEIGARQLGVHKKSRIRDLASLVPLSLYPLLTKKVGKYLL